MQFSTLRERSNKTISSSIFLHHSSFNLKKKNTSLHDTRCHPQSSIGHASSILEQSSSDQFHESNRRIESNRIQSPRTSGIKRQSVERERVAACGYDECGLEQRRIRGEKAAAGVTDLSPPITVQSVMFDAAVVFYAATSKRCVCIPRPTRLHPLHWPSSSIADCSRSRSLL